MLNFLPTPLHPAVVHLPIALSVLLPFFAVGALWAIRRGTQPRKAWGITTALFAALTISTWASVKSGEAQEEQVERVVAEAPIHTHEEAAEAFLLLSLGALGVAALGLSSGRMGTYARVLGAVGSIALLGVGFRVGHTGGQLVYRHGAASAYTDNVATLERAGSVERDSAAPGVVRDDERRRDDDDR
jgi:formate hydrogenlyase subunit 3/multisubunit Na+/H+ antiporter MnhD subunit